MPSNVLFTSEVAAVTFFYLRQHDDKQKPSNAVRSKGCVTNRWTRSTAV